MPKPYRIFNLFADSDFLFYYDDNSLRIVALYGIKSQNYDITKKWDTQLIVQNIDKEESYFRQRIDIDARQICLDYNQNIMFLRDRGHYIYQVNMNNFQMKSGT